jgi:hypothetical protein
MKKLSLAYAPELGLGDFPQLGVALSDYVFGNTERLARVGGGVLEGVGPGSRSIKIKYDLRASREKNVHEIEVSDASAAEEKRILSELRQLYKGFGFLAGQ